MSFVLSLELLARFHSGLFINILQLSDREQLPSDVMHLTVRATDADGLYSDAQVDIVCLDENDNSPRFKSRTSTARILESAQPGHVAARLIATDPDKGPNGEVFFRIQSGAYEKFVINSKTGKSTPKFDFFSHFQFYIYKRKKFYVYT